MMLIEDIATCSVCRILLTVFAFSARKFKRNGHLLRKVHIKCMVLLKLACALQMWVRAALSERDEQLDLKKRHKRQSSRAGRKGPEVVGK